MIRKAAKYIGVNMQVKKEEIRIKIMEVAADEFLRRGYEDSSMRVIAKKANTTLGNIYHYFPNKDSLLEAILNPTIENLETIISEHKKQTEQVQASITMNEALVYLEHLDETFDKYNLNCFLDKKIVILLKLNSSHLLTRKETILFQFKEHLKWHFNMTEDDSDFLDIILNMLIECEKHVLIEYEDTEQRKKFFLRFLKLICTGVIGHLK